MNTRAERERLGREWVEAVDRDGARDDRLAARDRCPACGGILEPRTSTAGWVCTACETLIGREPTLPASQIGLDDPWPDDFF